VIFFLFFICFCVVIYRSILVNKLIVIRRRAIRILELFNKCVRFMSFLTKIMWLFG